MASLPITHACVQALLISLAFALGMLLSTGQSGSAQEPVSHSLANNAACLATPTSTDDCALATPNGGSLPHLEATRPTTTVYSLPVAGSGGTGDADVWLVLSFTTVTVLGLMALAILDRRPD